MPAGTLLTLYHTEKRSQKKIHHQPEHPQPDEETSKEGSHPQCLEAEEPDSLPCNTLGDQADLEDLPEDPCLPLQKDGCKANSHRGNEGEAITFANQCHHRKAGKLLTRKRTIYQQILL
jgi:hypothetical protein